MPKIKEHIDAIDNLYSTPTLFAYCRGLTKSELIGVRETIHEADLAGRPVRNNYGVMEIVQRIIWDHEYRQEK